ncbi:hypothetical protein BO94DRAFT_472378 [Aspergillus sclerotioniger CBS 115572]|uniref:Uncharacterized protein n=1 Tax=Aspergillus sclerotioniger CBS 115572 TaxID=1450535 RepID=A0A317VUX0_9EURO|nr:hypothetical protein BO94DRAFT_472378 [Aspergillus sclerotioniger CBS 115572]PWY78093.1 hypothetical protein BO94DRAFT_472378 [Aspergillus sclerotioniger CBS 115572]
MSRLNLPILTKDPFTSTTSTSTQIPDLSLPILTKRTTTSNDSAPLVSIICTDETIQSSLLTQLLTEAYNKKPDAPRSLVVLSTDSKHAIQNLTPDSATQHPVTPFISPFLGMTETDVAGFLARTCVGSAISTKVFYIADDQTPATGNLQMVFMYANNPLSRISFPMEWEYANLLGVGVVRDPEITGEKVLSLIWKGVYKSNQPESPFWGDEL